MIRHRQPGSPQLGRPAGRERLTPGQLRALGRELGFPVYTVKAAAAAAASLAPAPRPEEGSPAERLRQLRREFRIRTAPADPRFITAIHEAGHAVVGADLGLRLRKVHIVPGQNADGSRFFGECHFWDLEGTPAGHRLAMLLAGPAAESRFTGRPTPLAGVDLKLAREAAGVWSLEASGLYRQADGRAKALVAEHWATIERIASHLVASPVLTADALRPLLES